MLFTRWVWHVFSLGISFSFLSSTHPFTLLSLTRYFGICSLIIFFYAVHLSRAQYLIICLIIGSIFNLMLNIFITERWKTHFPIHTFFERFALITLSFFSYEARVEGWIKDILVYIEYRSCDSVVLHTPFIFFTPRSFSGLSIEIL